MLENNYLTVQEADRKKQLEYKESREGLTEAELQEKSEIDKKDKSTDKAILDICTAGNKSSSECGALVQEALAAKDKFDSNFNYRLLYKELYPEDSKNVDAILTGLDAGSITHDGAIAAIAKETGKSYDEVAERYSHVMALHAITSTLAGTVAGAKLPGKGNTEKPVATDKNNVVDVGETTVNAEVGKNVLPNYKVSDLSKIDDPALNASVIRGQLADYVKKGDVDGISIATGSITVNGKTEYILAVSGKSWKGNASQTVNLNGIQYKVIVEDTKSVPSYPSSAQQTNYNHAEHKLFSYVKDNYAGQKADVKIAVENTSQNKPGMCLGCNVSANKPASFFHLKTPSHCSSSYLNNGVNHEKTTTNGLLAAAINPLATF